MSIIVRVVRNSLRRQFAYKINAVMTLFDAAIDCFSIWLFWYSLMELDLNLVGWDTAMIQSFIGYSLVADGLATVFRGSYDIERHIADGTLDMYLIRPCNPVFLIMSERLNLVYTFFMVPAGVVWIFCNGASGFWYDLLGILLCATAVFAVQLIEIIIYELAFWLKRVDSLDEMAEAVLDVSQYPIAFFGKKILWFFTYVILVAFIGTIPAELAHGRKPGAYLAALPAALAVLLLLAVVLWKLGRRNYESTN